MSAELPEHFRYERWDATLRGIDGTLATRHDDPCILCERLALSQELKAARERAAESDKRAEQAIREAVSRGGRLHNAHKDLEAAEAEVQRLRGALPATFYAELPLVDRVARMVGMWNRAIVALNEIADAGAVSTQYTRSLAAAALTEPEEGES